MFNEGNQIHNFLSSSGSGTIINYGSGYGSGSPSQKVTVPTVPVPVPVPQHCTQPDPSLPSPCYTLYEYIPLYFFTQAGGGVGEPVRRLEVR